MRKLMMVAMLATMLGTFPMMANAVTFANKVTSCVDVWAETLSDGSALVHFKGSDPKVVAHYAAGLSEYAPDEEADGAVDKWYESGSLFQGDPNHAVVKITKKALVMGLRGFNNIDSDGAWGPLPHRLVRIHFGQNLLYQNSKDPSGKGSENGQGGPHLTFRGDLSDEQASKFVEIPYPGGQACGQASAAATKTSLKLLKEKKATKMKKVACPGGKGICEEPCIEEIRKTGQDTNERVRDIQKDVKVIKTDVKDVKSSVGMPDPSEPANEKALQQKARITLDSVGIADKDDAVDEKTVQQKARKTLKKTKAIKKSLGEPKDGKTSVHEKLDEQKELLLSIKKQVDATGGHTIPPATTPFSNTCLKCHSDKAPKGR
jgi:hypothetical protein